MGRWCTMGLGEWWLSYAHNCRHISLEKRKGFLFSLFIRSYQMALPFPCTKKARSCCYPTASLQTEAWLMVPFLNSSMEKRGVNTGKGKLDKCCHPPCLQASGNSGGESQVGLSKSCLCSGQMRRSRARWGLRTALSLPGQAHVAASRLCLGSPGWPGAGNRRRAGGPSGGIMGPDNRTTDVTLPAICSQRQPCPCPSDFAPPPSLALVWGARGRAGQRWQVKAGYDTG